MHKILVITLCLITLIQAKTIKNFADDLIYDLIRSELQEQFPEDEKFVNCLEEKFKKNKIADKLYNHELIFYQVIFKKDIQPYVNEYYPICSYEYYSSAIYLIYVIIFLLIFLTMIYCCYNHVIQPFTDYVIIRRNS